MRRDALAEEIPYGPGNADYEYEARRDEAADTVREAMEAILAGRFDAPAVRDVLARRAGSFMDYQALRGQMEHIETLRRRAARLYHTSASLQEKWFSARIRLHRSNCHAPRVHIGAGPNYVAPRMLREAGSFGDITA